MSRQLLFGEVISQSYEFAPKVNREIQTERIQAGVAELTHGEYLASRLDDPYHYWGVAEGALDEPVDWDVHIDATGEGCCFFTSILSGGLTIARDTETGKVWIEESNVQFVNAKTFNRSVGWPDFEVSISEWLNDATFTEATADVVLEELQGSFAGSLVTFDEYRSSGWEFRDETHATRLRVLLDGNEAAFFGTSDFLGVDGTYFTFNARMVAVPEPAALNQFRFLMLASIMLWRRQKRSARYVCIAY